MANENGTESDVTVTLQTDRSAVSEWTIDKRVFGKFNEHLAGAIYPGIYADYVTNGLFEVWNYANLEGSPDVLYPNVETFPSLAYPWEPLDESESTEFEHAEGGVYGRQDELLFLVNGDLRETHTITVGLGDSPSGAVTTLSDRATTDSDAFSNGNSDEQAANDGDWPSAQATRLSGSSGDPFAVQTNWEALDGPKIKRFKREASPEGQIAITMPPGSVAKLEFDLS